LEAGADNAVVANHWALGKGCFGVVLIVVGGKGAVDLAKAVEKACEKPVDFKYLYPLDWSIKQKIETIAKSIYGAGNRLFRDISDY
jgi:formyltetrahydrofolate synthetase